MKNLLTLIQERQSARGLFDPARPVATEDLLQILEAGRWAPSAHNMQNYEIIAVDDKKLLEAIGDIKYQISDTFIDENYRQLSFSEEELLNKKVGIIASRFPPALRTPRVKTDNDTGEPVVTSLGRLVQTSPVLLIVLYDPDRRAPASEGDFLGIISLGCVMENMWLMAKDLGIGFHVISALGAGPVEKEVKSLLNVPAHLKIAFACRLGYPVLPPGPYLRVRRDVEDFTHHNRFGNKGLA
ncbi:MAG TPA: nitroreductase family protein [Spirochaetia bacterium]|nr:nitroreductase family protein [Spirochaetia bacterium]